MKASSIFLVVLLALFFTAGFAGYWLYNLLYAPVVEIPEGKQYLYLPSRADYAMVVRKLNQQGLIKDTADFKQVAEWMSYPSHVYSGRYQLTDGLSNRALVRKLRSGEEAMVDLTLSPFPDLPSLAGYVDQRLEADSARIVTLMNDPAVMDKYSVKPPTRLCLFIPNTYEFSWDTRAEAFLDRMYKQYQEFWTMQRKAKAREQRLEPKEVMTLASIVQKESTRIREWDTIAGVYLNRLNRANMPLQADPTLKYILEQRGEKEVNRIYKKHFKLKSPYNTYKNRGLPPGPLVIPQIQAIEAVLNPAVHDYLYFVAKLGKGGGHLFSETLREHNRKARNYHNYADDKAIY